MNPPVSSAKQSINLIRKLDLIAEHGHRGWSRK